MFLKSTQNRQFNSSLIFVVNLRNNLPMKYLFNTTALMIAGCLITISQPSFAQQPQTQKGFRCDTSSQVPTTIYTNSQGKSEPWIVWKSDYFSSSGWNPQSRCQEVSGRLETYRRSGKLKYATLGTQNNQPVICVTSKDQGPCEGTIYTLKAGQDGVASLNNFFAWASGQENLESNYESATEIPYINLEEKLNEDSANSPPVSESAPAVNREL
jgi:Circadian oscillating protein COP23